MRFYPIILGIILLVASCTTTPPAPPLPTIPAPLRAPVPGQADYTKPKPPTPPEPPPPTPHIHFKPTPVVPTIETGTSQLEKTEMIPEFKTSAPIQVNVEGLPVSAFINEIFGNLLGLSFEIAPNVQSKRELVTLRVSDPQPPDQLYRLARQVLLNYSVEIIRQDTLMRFVAIETTGTPSPSLVFTGATLPEVPPSHRSVIQFVTLKIVSTSQARGWLQQAFQNQPLNILEDYPRNILILVGTPQIVRQAAETLKVLDQPAMRGQYSVRIEPAFLPADTLSQRLIEILSSQGYQITASPQGGSIVVLTIRETNSLIVFAADPKVLLYVQQWAEQLDKINLTSPTPTKKPNLFFYQVKNTAAQPLANVINGLQQAAAALTVDPYRNALLFLGSNEDWVRLLPLLQEMDKPTKQVLIEATVAEITLSDKDERGVEWLIKNADIGGLKGKIGTLGTLGVGSAGLTYTLSGLEDVRAVLNAFVSSSRATILSTPRLMVRSGSSASITVGNEVPTLTSQSTSTQVQAGNSGILQQIQYRRTGITLNIQPTVFAGRRVDLTISQEVSSSQPNTTSNIDSPIILNRQLSTQLTLNDGQSILLGGLISSSRSQGETGIPVLKDLPVIGQLFRSDKNSQDRTELVILLVPYVIDGDEEAKAITEAFKRRLGLLPSEPAK
jgi:general secretion pathway protein D